MRAPRPFSSAMKGHSSHMNRRVGAVTNSAVFSACWSAIVFGASSPTTTCSEVIRAKAMPTAIEWAPARAQLGGHHAEQRLDRPRHRGLSDPAQPQAGHRNADLGRRDEAIGLGDGLPDADRTPVALGDQLVDPRLADGDNGKLGRDEEPVGAYQHQDGRQPAGDVERRLIHGGTLAGDPAGCKPAGRALRFGREEVAVHELGDRLLVEGIKPLEFEPHPDPVVAPGHRGVGFDLVLRARQPEPQPDR